MDELIATLERETEERCSEALEEARHEAGRVRRETEQRVERRRAAAAGELEAEQRAWENARLAATRKEVRGALLRARRHALDRVFSQAEQLLSTMLDDPAYLDALPGELERALSCVGDTEVELECRPGLARHLEAAAESIGAGGPGSTASVQVAPSDEAAAGFVVRGATSRVRVDATLATRLDVLRDELEPEVLEQLEQLEGDDR